MKNQISLIVVTLCTSLFFISCGNEHPDNTTHTAEATTSDEEVNVAKDLSEHEKVRATYVDFSFGDLAHYIFKPTDGSAEIDFAQNLDQHVALEMDDDNAPQGIGINPSMKGKTFDVYYKNEKVTPAGWDEADAMDGKVIYNLEEVKE